MMTLTTDDWMGRYIVESKETDSYEDYDANLFVVCLACRQTALEKQGSCHPGSLFLPELGCLGPQSNTSILGLMTIMELVLRHEEAVHS